MRSGWAQAWTEPALWFRQRQGRAALASQRFSHPLFSIVICLSVPPFASKTFTIQGGSDSGSSASGSGDVRGLMPRVFSYLTSQIASATASAGANKVQYTCTASFLEIYMERVFDLLEGTSPACNLREDTKRGVYVEGLKEEPVSTAAELERIMERGIVARRVGETAMNRESSRSHCVFTLNIASKTTAPNGAITERRSKFNLIDRQWNTRMHAENSQSERVRDLTLRTSCVVS